MSWYGRLVNRLGLVQLEENVTGVKVDESLVVCRAGVDDDTGLVHGEYCVY